MATGSRFWFPPAQVGIWKLFEDLHTEIKRYARDNRAMADITKYQLEGLDFIEMELDAYWKFLSESQKRDLGTLLFNLYICSVRLNTANVIPDKSASDYRLAAEAVACAMQNIRVAHHIALQQFLTPIETAISAALLRINPYNKSQQ